MFLFVLVTLMAAFFSEFFQAPKTLTQELDQYRMLFKPSDLEGIKKIKLTNRLGEFHLVKDEGHSFQDWAVVYPKKLPGSEAPVKLIFETLLDLKIRKIYPEDPINTANFALETPVLSIAFQNNKNEEVVVKFGLVNPIDNSTYISVSNKDSIYHIDSLNVRLDGLDLTSFVDSRIFTFPLERLQTFSIARPQGNNMRSFLKFSMKPETSEYYDESQNLLGKDEVIGMLGEFFSLRGIMLLDSIPKEAQETLKKYIESPAYQIDIGLTDGENLSFKITDLINHAIPELKLEKKLYYIIIPDHVNLYYVVPKESQKIWASQSLQRLKKIPVKKLFY